jgi:hypothetical protein
MKVVILLHAKCGAGVRAVSEAQIGDWAAS